MDLETMRQHLRQLKTLANLYRESPVTTTTHIAVTWPMHYAALQWAVMLAEKRIVEEECSQPWADPLPHPTSWDRKEPS